MGITMAREYVDLQIVNHQPDLKGNQVNKYDTIGFDQPYTCYVLICLYKSLS